MKKNRYILSLLLGIALLYYAVPFLSFDVSVNGVFSVVWVIFALFVISGNILGIFHSQKQTNAIKQKREVRRQAKSRRRELMH
jgi:hypothetical protein